MSKTEIAVAKPRSLAKGLIAGLIGGMAGAVAMSVAERMLPAHTHAEADPQASTTTTAAPVAIHWGFGAGVGAAYGVLAEFYPAATAKKGASFGMALETLTHEGAQPLQRARVTGFWPFLKLTPARSQTPSGLPPKPEAEAGTDDETIGERASEIASHVVYGVTTEWVRSFLRKRI